MRRRDRIALIGGTGTGKTSAARWLELTRGFQVCSTGEVCRRVTRILFGTEAKGRLNDVSDALENLDPLIFLTAAWRDVNVSQPIVIDSVRTLADYSFARQHSFTLIRILAPLECRTRWLQSRGQMFTRSEILLPNETRLETAQVDAEIVNDGQMQRMFDAIGALAEAT